MEGFIIRLRNCGICFVIAFLLFKFGGWHIIWGHEFTRGERFLVQTVSYVAPSEVITDGSQSFIATKNGVVVRINKKFYGVAKDTKYFDSPFIQWVMLFCCLGGIAGGIKALFDDDW